MAFGGSPSADELQRKVAETFPNVRSTSNAYGLTETSSVATVISGDDAKRKPRSVGPPVPTVEVRIVDADGQVLGAGETGEVCIRGPDPHEGLLEQARGDRRGHRRRRAGSTPATSATSTTRATSTITDRKKDMIIRGGENIYCVEIENRLVDHPAIADAAVIGVPHAELGEEVKAVVQVEPVPRARP